MKKLDKFKNNLATYNFVKRAYNEIESINSKEYFIRDDNFTKKLIDEILPIATFLKHFEKPGLAIKCQYFPGNQNYDAKIQLSGYYKDKGYFEQSYFIEVTSARNPKDYLIREALARDGIIGGEDVERIGSKSKGNDKIIARGKARDMDSPVKDAIEWTASALKKKYDKKETYPKPCILLIDVVPARPLGLSEWLAVIIGVRKTIDPEKFKATYLVNWETNVTFKI